MQHRAHGKVILLGEHSVVYGHPALAGALADGVTVEATPGRGLLRIAAWELVIDPAVAIDAPLARAYAELRRRAGEPAIDLALTFNLPTGAGLGSSAAMAVAIGRALGLEGGALAEAAMASETVIHGKPSGLDHTVSMAGGFGLYTRAGGLQPLPRGALAPHHRAHRQGARHQGARGAGGAAARRTQRRGARPLRAQSRRWWRAAPTRWRAASYGELGAAMNENQRHLEALDVSCAEIERMCAVARDAGAFGAKLTGGGGGGCVIAVGSDAAVADGVAPGGL